MSVLPPPAQALQFYRERGFTLVPLRPKTKKPYSKDWQSKSAEDLLKEFRSDNNVGIRLGDGGLVDLDLDCPEARSLAPLFIPPTPMKSGRKSARGSHWWFTCDEPLTYFQPTDPLLPEDDPNHCILELRSAGRQTAVWPSVHEDEGELYEWEGPLRPEPTDTGMLLDGVRRLAAVSLLARYWPSGARHATALSLAGALVRNRWHIEDAVGIVSAAASCAGDNEPDDRERAVRDTYANFNGGKHTSGIPTLTNYINPQVVDRVCEWLNLSNATESEPDLDEVLSNPDKPAVPYILPFGVFITFPFPEPSWLVEGILHNQDVSSTNATPKSLKTWWEMYMHMCIASGTWMFDKFAVGEPRKTIYVQDDQAAGSFQSNVRRLALGMGMDMELLNQNMLFVVQQQVRFDEPSSLERIIAAIAEHRPALVSFDTFRSAHHADENDSTTMNAIMSTTKRIRDEWATAVGLVHHTTKLGVDLRGSSAIWGALDNQIKIEKVEVDGMKYGKVSFDGRGFDWVEPFKFHLEDVNNDARHVKIRYDSLNPGELQTSKERRKLAVLDALAYTDGATIYDLMETLGVKSRGSMDVYLKELEAEGKVAVSIGLYNRRNYALAERPDEPDF